MKSKRQWVKPLLGVVALTLCFDILAHSGRTNAEGYHAGSQPYHCHNSGGGSSSKKSKKTKLGSEDYLKRNGYQRDAYSRWSDRSRQNVESALRTVNISYNQALTREQMVRALQAQNRNATTRNALLQAGNDISIMQVQESMALEQLLRQQIAMRAEHQALAEAKQADEQVSLRRAEEEREISRQWLDNQWRQAEESRKGRRHRLGKDD